VPARAVEDQQGDGAKQAALSAGHSNRPRLPEHLASFAQVNRRSRLIRGREPRLAQMRAGRRALLAAPRFILACPAYPPVAIHSTALERGWGKTGIAGDLPVVLERTIEHFARRAKDAHRTGCGWRSRTCASATRGGISGRAATFPPPAATSRTMSYFSIFTSTNLPASAAGYSVAGCCGIRLFGIDYRKKNSQ
jgi:hypothetical protein